MLRGDTYFLHPLSHGSTTVVGAVPHPKVVIFRRRKESKPKTNVQFRAIKQDYVERSTVSLAPHEGVEANLRYHLKVTNLFDCQLGQGGTEIHPALPASRLGDSSRQEGLCEGLMWPQSRFGLRGDVATD